jgi:tripartite ATP-independent transporter DctP family solute receptor
VRREGALIAGLFLVLLVLSLVLTGCGGAQTDEQQDGGGRPLILRAAHTVAETHPYHLGLEKFAELVKQRTNAEIEIEIYPNGRLGSEKDLIPGLQINTVDLMVSPLDSAAPLVPELTVLDLPFLFRDREHAYKVLDGHIGQGFLQRFETKHIKALAFWEDGFYHLTNSKRPVNEPADIEGLRIRTLEKPAHQEAFQALGAVSIPMAESEVLNALQQEVIDGQENQIVTIHNQGIYEVQQHLALTGHIYSPSLLLMSKTAFDQLTQEEQQVFREAAQEVATYQRGLIKQQDEALLGRLISAGVQVTEPAPATFRVAMQAVYERFAQRFGSDLILEVLQME